jgi:branched-chain amino acid transport system ATP-binding protein
MARTILTVDGLTKRFGGLTAVDAAHLTVPEGQITGVIGPNGAGKSTLFDCITGITAPDAGSVRLGETELVGRAPHAIAHAGVGRTFQTPRIFEGMTVRENMAFAAVAQTGESVVGALARPGAVAAEEAETDARVDELLAFLTLDPLATAYAGELSGGQRKLLELGRVLMLDPTVLLLDEPLAGVNPTLGATIVDRLEALRTDGRTIVLIEHDLELVMRLCDTVVVLHHGATLAAGPPSVIRADPQVIDAYLGRMET